jgi:hypothetical protein
MPDLFSALDEDIYKPKVLKPSLAQYDNYQIYSLVCVDREVATIQKTYYRSDSRGLNVTFDYSNNTASLVAHTPTLVTNAHNQNKQGSWLAIQSFSPAKIKIDFIDYVNRYHE